MPIDPRTLEAIRNPLAGLGGIGQAFLKGREYRIAQEESKEKRLLAQEKQKREIEKDQRLIEKRAEEKQAFELKQKRDLLKYDEEQKEGNLSDATSVAGYLDKFKADVQANPQLATDPVLFNQYRSESLQFITDPDVQNVIMNTDPSNYPQIRSNAQLAIDAYTQAKGDEQFGEFQKIPGTELYGQPSSKTGKFANVREGIDGKSKLGNSEFERGLQRSLDLELIDQEEANRLQKTRTEVLAGTEMRAGPKSALEERKLARENKETREMQKDYTAGADHFKNMSQSLEGALAAMETGDTGLTDILLNQVMSQVQDTDVRAFQMYQVFDKEFGNLAERVQGMVSRFFAGTRTEREREEIKNVLTRFKNKYVDPGSKKMRDRYRELAIMDEKDPFEVVPPQSPEDIKDTTLLSKKEKVEMIKRFFPDWKPK
jgi:hypothetical protein